MLPGSGRVHFAVGRLSPAGERSYPASQAFSLLRQMLECALPRGKLSHCNFFLQGSSISSEGAFHPSERSSSVSQWGTVGLAAPSPIALGTQTLSPFPDKAHPSGLLAASL
jgi:hypothetical protein